MGVGEDALLELQWSTEQWALQTTGSGLYEATQKQVGYIVNLIDKVPSSDEAKVDAILSGFGLPLDWDMSDLKSLASKKASNLIDALKDILPAGAGLTGAATPSQLNYLKKLLVKVDHQHDEVKKVLIKQHGLFYMSTAPEVPIDALSQLTKATASAIIDWLKKNGFKYPPGSAVEKANPGQLIAISELEMELIDEYDVPDSVFNQLRKMIAGSTSKQAKEWTKTQADAYIAALGQEQEKAAANAAVGKTMGPAPDPITNDQYNVLSAMAKGLDYKAPPLKKAGVYKKHFAQGGVPLTHDEAHALILDLVKYMVGPQQLTKLKGLVGKVGSMGDGPAAEVNKLLQPYDTFYPNMWGTIKHKLGMSLSKKNATTLIKQLQALAKAGAKKATTEQVGRVLGLLMQVGPKKWKASPLSKQWPPAKLRTQNLKKLSADEISVLITKLVTLTHL